MSEQTTYSVDYWKEYLKQGVTMRESSFAQFCLPYVQREKNLLSICCGNGRDSVFFKKNGLNVWAFDIVPADDTFFKFRQLNLLDKQDRFGYSMTFDYVYCRFVLHAIPEELEDYILTNAEKVLPKKGLLFIEARSDKGDITSGVNHHYRRLINLERLKQKLSELNFVIIYEEEAENLSIYNNENPVLIRIVAKRMGCLDPVVGKELLLMTKEILDLHKIRFFLAFGTMLGAYRDHQFIPHDWDIDIGLFMADRPRFMELVKSKVFSNRGMSFRTNGFPNFNTFEYGEEWIDLFFFRKEHDKYRCKCFYIDAEHFRFGLMPIQFLDTTFKMVHFPEKYLEDRYGKDWRIPKKGIHTLM